MRVLPAALALVALSLAPAGADAAFPGQNGKIAFTSDRDGNSEVYAMNADGTGQTRLTTNAAADSQPAFSPDGQQIAFTGTVGVPEVFVMSPDGTNRLQLTSNSASSDFQPAFSPDGQEIAFTSDRDQLNQEIYVMDAIGNAQTRRTANVAVDSDPAFSPDGQRIAFASFRDGNSEVYAMNANGSSPLRLTSNAVSDSVPDWQPLPTADLSLEQSDSPDPVTVGSELTYTITVRNAVADPAISTRVTDTLPGGVSFVSASTSQGSCQGTATVTCALGAIPRQASATVALVVRPSAPGQISNTASVTTTSSDPVPADNAATTTTLVVAPLLITQPPVIAPPPALLAGRCANQRTGTGANDTLNGTVAGDRLLGLGGNDILNGLQSDDCLVGGPGRDRLTGSEGRDSLGGGAGNDVLNGGTGPDALTGGAGKDRLVGGPGRNSYAAGAGNDQVLATNRRRETIDCGAGRDTARVDRSDRVRGCERVRRTRSV